jgi:hypothetical protein
MATAPSGCVSLQREPAFWVSSEGLVMTLRGKCYSESVHFATLFSKPGFGAWVLPTACPFVHRRWPGRTRSLQNVVLCAWFTAGQQGGRWRDTALAEGQGSLSPRGEAGSLTATVFKWTLEVSKVKKSALDGLYGLQVPRRAPSSHHPLPPGDTRRSSTNKTMNLTWPSHRIATNVCVSGGGCRGHTRRTLHRGQSRANRKSYCSALPAVHPNTHKFTLSHTHAQRHRAWCDASTTHCALTLHSA